MDRAFDVIVVGLGHAGCEAALACARLGFRTLAVTLREDRIALMSCNPAIGGTAKGHLVREMDALGGQMGRAADLTAIHVRTLNASKGPAVRATRMLCDRDAYARTMRDTIQAQPRLTVLEGRVDRLEVEGHILRGIVLATGERIEAPAVILTTGTFLQAVMHVGAVQSAGGRHGDAPALGLSDSLRALGFTLGRFKTGTPPRLFAESIDWGRCALQPGDSQPRPFSARTGNFPVLDQRPCHVTHTNPATHAAVRGNLDRSPLYDGTIRGRGPRYCPSLEDKVVRFADRARHTVFLEPEGLDSPLIYPAGLSTSLPAEAQREFLRTIPGLERVEVARPGYAVEYDYAPPTQLQPTLESRRIRGLWFAGQLNGTSGYEEAAVQGLLAGANVALRLRGEAPLILRRAEAHAGVLIDELVQRGLDEPFRMLTSRSEHRLTLREGNADLRLAQAATRLGLVEAHQRARVERRREAIAREQIRLERSGLTERLRNPAVGYAELAGLDPNRPELPDDVVEEVEAEIKYAGYIARAERRHARLLGGPDAPIPDGLRPDEVRGLSREAQDILARYRPATIEAAARLPGLTPAALALLRIHLQRRAAA
jgi:tRNA uridine 5-carboxymethylaminomethyl modification enzyme